MFCFVIFNRFILCCCHQWVFFCCCRCFSYCLVPISTNTWIICNFCISASDKLKEGILIPCMISLKFFFVLPFFLMVFKWCFAFNTFVWTIPFCLEIKGIIFPQTYPFCVACLWISLKIQHFEIQFGNVEPAHMIAWGKKLIGFFLLFFIYVNQTYINLFSSRGADKMWNFGTLGNDQNQVVFKMSVSIQIII